MKKLLIAGYENAVENYRKAFAQLGIYTDTLTHMQEEGFYDGLVLPGGGDIAPDLFGAANLGSHNIDKPLDRLQLTLLKHFLALEKPILGICKGMQLINLFFGGSLIQDLPETSLEIHAYDEGDRLHATKASRNTFVGTLYGSSLLTNSAHHQAVSDIGDGLFVAQYACDFVVEALYHKSLPVFGVQWHPERMYSSFWASEGCASPQTADGTILLRYFSTLL